MTRFFFPKGRRFHHGRPDFAGTALVKDSRAGVEIGLENDPIQVESGAVKAVIQATFLTFCACLSGLAQPEPKGASSGLSLESKETKEVLEMEKKIRAAIEGQDTKTLEKILADAYFDTYEGSENAMSKSGTIARCKAGVLNFLVIEKEPQLTREPDGITVEGETVVRPIAVDDVTPERRVRVRRLWTKRAGAWLLMSQRRRLLEPEKAKD